MRPSARRVGPPSSSAQVVLEALAQPGLGGLVDGRHIEHVADSIGLGIAACPQDLDRAAAQLTGADVSWAAAGYGFSSCVVSASDLEGPLFADHEAFGPPVAVSSGVDGTREYSGLA